MVYSQLESTASKSKGNVKFNLDENTELKFEMSGDENDDLEVEDGQQEAETEETEEEESTKSSNPNQVIRSPWMQNGGGDSSRFSTQPHSIRDRESEFNAKGEVPYPQYSESAIEAMKKAMRNEMEAELKIFQEKLEGERKLRQEQIQKHLEETVSQFKSEKDDILKRIRKDMDNERTNEVDKAKREIDTLLQRELEEMKTKFNATLQQKQKELEEEHQKKIEELTSSYRKKGEDRVSEVLSKQSSEESLNNEVMAFRKQKEDLREEHRIKIMEMKDYHSTILDRLKADMKADEDKIREDHASKQAEIVAKFQRETEDLKNKLIKKQEEDLNKIQEEFEKKRAALEISMNASLENMGKNKRSASETNIADKAAGDELRSMKEKYQQLEGKYRVMKTELQNMIQQESSPKKRGPISETNNKKEQKSIRSSVRSTPKLKNIQRNESFEISDTNQDSAHGSESNTDTNSSLYPSSDGVGPRKKDVDSDDINENLSGTDSISQTQRLNAALQALEVLKKEIMDLKNTNGHKHPHKKESQQITPETMIKKPLIKPITSSPTKVYPASARPSSKYDLSPSPHQEPRSARKKPSTGSVSVVYNKLSRKVSDSPPTHDSDHPKYVSRSVSVVPQDFSGSNSEPIVEDAHKTIVNTARSFIENQKRRLNDPSPIPDSSHLIPKTNSNILLFDEKLLKSVTPRRPASLHLDFFSETESSGVSSLKDHRSSESKKISKDIDEICNSLNNLDQQMKLMWSVVKGKQDESLTILNTTANSSLTTSPFGSDIRALLPNTMPIILGKSRVSASMPASARKPIVPPSSPSDGLKINAGKHHSALLNSSQTTASGHSQTVLEALRMSGISTSRLSEGSELIGCLEDEMQAFTAVQERLQNITSYTIPGVDRRFTTVTKHVKNTNNSNSNKSIQEQTKELKNWADKYH
ncbi:unnamed protein product [Orchesella dallaii]